MIDFRKVKRISISSTRAHVGYFIFRAGQGTQYLNRAFLAILDFFEEFQGPTPCLETGFWRAGDVSPSPLDAHLINVVKV